MVRDLIITTSDRLKVAWRALLARLEALALRLIDRYLARRDEERSPKLLAFDELPVLWDEDDFATIGDTPPHLSWPPDIIA